MSALRRGFAQLAKIPAISLVASSVLDDYGSAVSDCGVLLRGQREDEHVCVAALGVATPEEFLSTDAQYRDFIAYWKRTLALDLKLDSRSAFENR